MKKSCFLWVLLMLGVSAVAVNTLAENFDEPTHGFPVVSDDTLDGAGHFTMDNEVPAGNTYPVMTLDKYEMKASILGQLDSFDAISPEWTVGEGTIAQETTILREGTGSMKLEGGAGNVDAYKYYTPFDANDRYFQFWCYGDGSGNQMQFILIDTAGNVARYIDNLTWTGWRPIVVKANLIGKEAFSPTFNYSSIQQVHFFIEPSVTPRGDVYVDDLRVESDPSEPMEISYCEPSSPYVYQIASYNGATHSYDMEDKTEGASSLVMNFTTAQAYEEVCIYLTHYLDGEAPPVGKDFTKYSHVEFDLYGDGSGHRLEFRFHTGGWPIYIWLRMTHVGWKHYTLSRSDFTVYPGASWSNIDSVRFYNSDGTAMNIKLDNLRLVNPAPMVPPYQIASFDDWVNDGWDDQRKSGYMLQSPPGEVHEGTGALRIKFEDFNGTYDEVASKDFIPSLNFAGYEGLALTFWVWSDGVNDSRLHQIILYDKDFKTGRYTVSSSLSAGWRQIYAPLADFVWDGGQIPDWSTIRRIDFWFSCHPKPGNSVYLDDLWLIERPSLPGQQFLINAAKATIIVDGDAVDWAGLESDIVEFDLTQVPNQPKGNLHVQYRLAWDNDYLYILVEELPGDTLATEAPGLDWLDDGQGGDIRYDSLSLYFDFTNNSMPGSAEGIDLWLYLGFKTTDANDLMMAWTNGEWGPHKPDAITHGAVFSTSPYTDPNEALGHRVIETKVKWSDLDAHIEAARLPAGGLLAAVRPGYIFGCDPRLNDLEGTNAWDSPTTEIGAAWLNGNLWTNLPSGRDPFSIDVRLICFPGDLDGDCDVDLEDFAILNNEWQRTECSDLNTYCNSADIVIDGSVELSDLAEFVRVWLSGI